MKWLWCLALLGCGPKWETPYECKLYHTTAYFEFEPDCGVLQQNINLAQSILERRGLMTIQENQMFTRDIPIYVYNMTTLWRNSDGTYTVGEWNGQGVHMTREGSSLLHEWLHVMDSARWQLGTAWHENWDKNGYDEADAEFSTRFIDLWRYSIEAKKLKSANQK